MSAGKDKPEFYHHKVKDKPVGYQRQDANAVRARSKAAYRRDPERAKVISAKWYGKHPEKRREYWRAGGNGTSTGQR